MHAQVGRLLKNLRSVGVIVPLGCNKNDGGLAALWEGMRLHERDSRPRGETAAAIGVSRELTDYEKLQQRNMERNKQKVVELGLSETLEKMRAMPPTERKLNRRSADVVEAAPAKRRKGERQRHKRSLFSSVTQSVASGTDLPAGVQSSFDLFCCGCAQLCNAGKHPHQHPLFNGWLCDGVHQSCRAEKWSHDIYCI